MNDNLIDLLLDLLGRIIKIHEVLYIMLGFTKWFIKYLKLNGLINIGIISIY